MKPETASKLRKIFLVLTIIFDICMFICWYLGGQIVFGWTFVGINVCVFAGEIINNFFVYRKTLSTQVTKTLEQGGWKAWVTGLAVVFMGLSIASLMAHLLIFVKPEEDKK